MPDSPDLIATKTALRAAMTAIRNVLEPADRAARSEAICARIAGLLEFEGPGPLGAYWPWRSEVDPRNVLHAAHDRGMACVLPAFAEDGAVVFRAWARGDPVVPAGFGTMGPAPTAPVVDPVVMVVPCLAFDRAGMRLGYGQGHYDRAIARLSAHGLLTIGVAFAVQEVERLPAGAYDRHLDIIVTEREIIRPAARA